MMIVIRKQLKLSFVLFVSGHFFCLFTLLCNSTQSIAQEYTYVDYLNHSKIKAEVVDFYYSNKDYVGDLDDFDNRMAKLEKVSKYSPQFYMFLVEDYLSKGDTASAIKYGAMSVSQGYYKQVSNFISWSPELNEKIRLCIQKQENKRFYDSTKVCFINELIYYDQLARNAHWDKYKCDSSFCNIKLEDSVYLSKIGSYQFVDSFNWYRFKNEISFSPYPFSEFVENNHNTQSHIQIFYRHISPEASIYLLDRIVPIARKHILVWGQAEAIMTNVLWRFVNSQNNNMSIIPNVYIRDDGMDWEKSALALLSIAGPIGHGLNEAHLFTDDFSKRKYLLQIKDFILRHCDVSSSSIVLHDQHEIDYMIADTVIKPTGFYLKYIK